jgi:catechol 2,3-dioxygenase-like lactoylglutathione lyase family enzyme
MIEHTGLQVKNMERSKRFYTAALKPLGYTLHMDMGDAAGFKEGGHTSFWIGASKKVLPMHLAFRAKSRQAVRAFYKAALKAGGKDNGAPGLRKNYSPNYYAAFTLDLDGNNIEAVCFKTE